MRHDPDSTKIVSSPPVCRISAISARPVKLGNSAAKEWSQFLVACYKTTPRFVGPSVGPSVRRSVRHTLLFLGFCGLWPHSSHPNDGVTANGAPAHPHATRVAVYPALFFMNEVFATMIEKDANGSKRK